MIKKRPILVDGDIAYVELTQGYTSIIDAEDARIAELFNWCVLKRSDKRTIYAHRKMRDGSGHQKIVYLHRAVMGLPAGCQIDHIDGNGLNNRKSNLRLCEVHQNARNRGAQVNNQCGFKGVFWDKSRGKWRAHIHALGKTNHLGRFETLEQARNAYAKANKKIHGEFGRVE